MRPPVHVLVGDRDLTNNHQGLTFSNTDPGGFEALNLTTMNLAGIRPGAPVAVRIGSEIAWHGRMNEPGKHERRGRTEDSLAALGYGAKLKDNTMREIYIDRDLGRWTSPSRQRQIDLEDPTTGKQHLSGSFAVQADPTSGVQAIQLAFDRLVVPAPSTPQPSMMVIAAYDAMGIDIGSIWMGVATTNTIALNGDWFIYAYTSYTERMFSTTSSTNLAGGGSSYLTGIPAGDRFAEITLYYIGNITTDGIFRCWWRNPAVYGRHGLTMRGDANTDPMGFYPYDIVHDVMSKSVCGFDRRISTGSTYIVPHAVYVQPVTYEQVISDMGNLMGWHWGTWEPNSLLSTNPQFFFAPRPDNATCSIARGECDEIELPKVRLDQLYDTAVVGYHTVAGNSAVQTVTLANPLLTETGVGSRTMALDMGLGSAGAATDFGILALQLAAASARGSGSAVLPDTVSYGSAGRKPAALLKAGRDRIRISDIPDGGALTETDTRRYDTFRIVRVETSVDTGGVLRTRVEFDGGGDLLEVLTARMAAGQVGTGG